MSLNPIPPQNDSDLSRFMESFVELDQGYETPCWVWQRTMFSQGYGCFTAVSNGKSRAFRAHRVLWTWNTGVEPVRPLDHLCHDPETCAGGPSCPHRACVNPAHLKEVTQRDNVVRGSGPSAVNALKEKSISGSDLDYVDPRGWRGSKADRNAAAKRYHEKNREEINAKKRANRERVVHVALPCSRCGTVMPPKQRSTGRFCDKADNPGCFKARMRENRLRRMGK